MNYDVFICYSVCYSSRVYELAAQLGRESLTCTLDCVDSGFTLSDYTRNLIEECLVCVLLVDEGFIKSSYAMALMQCAINEKKSIAACLASGVQLTEELTKHCTQTTEETLLADIRQLVDSAPPTTDTTITPEISPELEMRTDAETKTHADSDSNIYIASPSYDNDTKSTDEVVPWSIGTFTITPVTKEEEETILYTEKRGKDPKEELDRQRVQLAYEKLYQVLVPNEDEEDELDDDEETEDEVAEGEFEGFGEGYEFEESDEEELYSEEEEKSEPLIVIPETKKKIFWIILFAYILIFILETIFG